MGFSKVFRGCLFRFSVLFSSDHLLLVLRLIVGHRRRVYSDYTAPVHVVYLGLAEALTYDVRAAFDGPF